MNSSLELICKLDLTDPNNTPDRTKFMFYDFFLKEKERLKYNNYANVREMILRDIAFIYIYGFGEKFKRNEYHSILDFFYDVTNDYSEIDFHNKTCEKEVYHRAIDRFYDSHT